MLQIQNVTELRKTLLSRDTTPRYADVRKFYENLHDDLVSFSGGNSESAMSARIRTSLKSSLSLSTVSEDSRIIADIVYSWGIAYPEQMGSLIAAIHLLPDELRGKGEGVATGIMEALNRVHVEEGNRYAAIYFQGLVKGGIFEIMNNSVPSSKGSGRLTNAISLFTAYAWDDSKLGVERRAICALALRALRNNCDAFFRESAAYDIHQVLKAESGNFLLTFTREFASKFILNGPLKALLSSSYGFSETEMELWQECFPDLKFVNK